MKSFLTREGDPRIVAFLDLEALRVPFMKNAVLMGPLGVEDVQEVSN